MLLTFINIFRWCYNCGSERLLHSHTNLHLIQCWISNSGTHYKDDGNGSVLNHWNAVLAKRTHNYEDILNKSKNLMTQLKKDFTMMCNHLYNTENVNLCQSYIYHFSNKNTYDPCTAELLMNLIMKALIYIFINNPLFLREKYTQI